MWPFDSNALERTLTSGKNVNTAVDAMMATRHPVMKTSPPNKPRAASPHANSMANDVRTSDAPRPMPC